MTYKLPPMPTPPVTVIAPVVVDVDPVEDEIMISFVNVLIPANDCANVETKPVAPVPAIGILKVCVLPEEDILNPVPVVPVVKNCADAVRPFTDVIERPATLDHLSPDAVVLSAVNTKLSVPTFILINVLPTPTRRSPLAYELYPVPP